jgi:hypothetical protein
MRSYMKRLQNWLRSANVLVNSQTLAGGHEFATWSIGLNESISIAYELTPSKSVQRSDRPCDF